VGSFPYIADDKRGFRQKMMSLVDVPNFTTNPFSADISPYLADDIPYIADISPYIADDKICRVLKRKPFLAFFWLKLFKTLKTRQKLTTYDKNSVKEMSLKKFGR